MRIKCFSPRSTRIRKQDGYMSCRLHHFINQVFYALNLGNIRWNGDRFCVRGEVGKCIQSGDSRAACGGFTGGDIDFGGPGLEESGGLSVKLVHGNRDS
jgi:hypothetical protein